MRWSCKLYSRLYCRLHSAGPERRAEHGCSDVGEHGREHDERPGLQAVDGLLPHVLKAGAVEQDWAPEQARDGQGEAQAQQAVHNLEWGHCCFQCSKC